MCLSTAHTYSHPTHLQLTSISLILSDAMNIKLTAEEAESHKKLPNEERRRNCVESLAFSQQKMFVLGKLQLL